MTDRLLPHHLADLRRSGLSDQTIGAAGFRSAPEEQVRSALGRSDVGAALEIPYHSPFGHCPFSRYRPDHPPLGSKGRPSKYLTPKGGGNRVYFPTNLRDGVLADPGVDLLVTEGEKKALKATQEGFPCIGLAGVWCFRTRNPSKQESESVRELDFVAWQGRRVFVVYDSDLAEKPEVRSAEKALATELGRRGAVVMLVRLPSGPTGQKVGLDDFLVMHGERGRGELQALLDRAEPARTAVFQLTDVGNGQRLAARHGRDLRYLWLARRWLCWDGRRWAPDERGRVEEFAKETAQSMLEEAAKERDDDQRARLSKHAARSQDSHRIQAMIRMCASEPGIAVSPEDLDRDPWLLNVLNGTVNLRTGELQPHCREDLITKICPVEYRPEAACPTWNRFLNEVTGDSSGLVAFLRRAAGASLAGEQRDHVLLLLYGTGANGKTTFVETLLAMLGDYGQQTSTSTFLERRSEGIRTDIADLQGVRFVSAVESKPGRKLDETLVKSLTGGDTIRARHLYQEADSYKPQCTIWLATNHKPAIYEQTQAMWRRIKAVPFAVCIPTEKQDHELRAKLKAELSGILAWSVAGCLEWQRSGLGTAEEVEQATTAYREEEDSLAGFLETECVTEPWARVTASIPLRYFA